MLSFKNALAPIFSTFIYYLFYEWVHLAHHSVQYKPITKIGKSLKEAHMQHHFHNENYNWGITNLMADYFLETLKCCSKIKPKSFGNIVRAFSDRMGKRKIHWSSR